MAKIKVKVKKSAKKNEGFEMSKEAASRSHSKAEGVYQPKKTKVAPSAPKGYMGKSEPELKK